jgi:hypothetical protein
MSLCILAAGKTVTLTVATFTLAWTHSVEKIVWEEDWRSGAAGLELVEARVRGSGAGMEPPPEARLANGVWSWRPNLPPQAQVTMRRSGATADWRICVSGACQPMEAYVPADADPIVMTACEGS